MDYSKRFKSFKKIISLSNIYILDYIIRNNDMGDDFLYNSYKP